MRPVSEQTRGESVLRSVKASQLPGPYASLVLPCASVQTLVDSQNQNRPIQNPDPVPEVVAVRLQWSSSLSRRLCRLSRVVHQPRLLSFPRPQLKRNFFDLLPQSRLSIPLSIPQP